MFLNMSEIKGLVFDLDSITSWQEIEWKSFPKDKRILVFSKNNQKKLEFVKEKNKDILIKIDLSLSTIDKLTNINSIQHIKGLMELDIHQFAIVTENREIVKALQKLPINIIEFNPSSYNEELDDYQNVADFNVTNTEQLLDILSYKNIGFYTEFVKIKNLPKITKTSYSQLLVRRLKTSKNNSVKVVAGGRYFTFNDPRSYAHLLSHRILWNKKKSKSQHKIFTTLYTGLISYVNDNIKYIDSICYIPKRPNDQEYDRFKDIVDNICQTQEKDNLNANLHCIRDYEKQKGLGSIQRVENIKDAFSFDGDTNLIKDKHVVIVDDIFVTGASTFELSDLIYKLGAKQVTIVVLALNQIEKTEQRDFGIINCTCGSKMIVNFNTKDGKSSFFGCPDYKNSSKKHIKTLSYDEGILDLFKVNDSKIEKYKDDPDVFF